MDVGRLAQEVREGRSKVFENWHRYGLVTEDEFIEGLEWLHADPLDGQGRLTRELGLRISPDMRRKLDGEQDATYASPYDETRLKGELVRLRQVYDSLGSFYGYYRVDDGMLWTGSDGPSISCRDRI